MIKSLLSSVALMALCLPCEALPQGSPPLMPMTFVGDYWGCIIPVKIIINGLSVGHETPNGSSKVVNRLRKMDGAVVLEVRDVGTEPGIAEVKRSDFDNNALDLPVGIEVYALAEWEFLYYHAWVDGHEVEGGLPLADETYFKFTRMPKVERWILLQPARAAKTKN